MVLSVSDLCLIFDSADVWFCHHLSFTVNSQHHTGMEAALWLLMSPPGKICRTGRALHYNLWKLLYSFLSRSVIFTHFMTDLDKSCQNVMSGYSSALSFTTNCSITQVVRLLMHSYILLCLSEQMMYNCPLYQALLY